MTMPGANVDISAPKDSFMQRTHNVTPADLDQAIDRVALGKSHYSPDCKRYPIDD